MYDDRRKAILFRVDGQILTKEGLETLISIRDGDAPRSEKSFESLIYHGLLEKAGGIYYLTEKSKKLVKGLVAENKVVTREMGMIVRVSSDYVNVTFQVFTKDGEHTWNKLDYNIAKKWAIKVGKKNIYGLEGLACIVECYDGMIHFLEMAIFPR